LKYCLGDTERLKVNKQILDGFNQIAFTDIEGKKVPNLQLMRDTRLADNALSSFLGDDYTSIFQLFLSEDEVDFFKSSTLNNYILNELDKILTDPSQVYSWISLFAVIGDFIPYDNTIKKLCEATTVLTFSLRKTVG